MNATLRVKRLTKTATLPAYARPGDAGMDLCASEEIRIPPGSIVRIATGLAIEIPEGHEGQVRPRSGLSLQGLVAITGTIDSGYRGEIGLVVQNHCGVVPHYVKPGDRIAQLVISPVARCAVIETEELSRTERGSAGFGSTGVASAPVEYAPAWQMAAGAGCVHLCTSLRVDGEARCFDCGQTVRAPGWDANGTPVP